MAWLLVIVLALTARLGVKVPSVAPTKTPPPEPLPPAPPSPPWPPTGVFVGVRAAGGGDGLVGGPGKPVPPPTGQPPPPAFPAVGSGAPVPAGRLVEGHGDVGNGRGRGLVHRQAAANAFAAHGPA